MVQVLKRSLLFFVALFLLSIITHAQSAFDGTTRILQLGVGAGRSPHYLVGTNYATFNNSPLLVLAYEQALKKQIGPGYFSLGAQLGWRSTRYRSVTLAPLGWYEEKNTWSDFGLGARLMYHLTEIDAKKLDVYGGLIAGPTFSKRATYAGYQDAQTYSYVNKRFLLSSWNSGFALGAHYFFNSKIAVMLEGQWLWRMSNLNVGVAVKM